MNTDCLFCKIATGQIPSTLVYEDEICVAFDDINPQAPTHILLIPRDHISSLNDFEEHQGLIIGHLMLKAAFLARKSGFADDGYRVVVNTNKDGGQTVFHLHIHLLGGRKFTFPPG